jgi:hypothetical protein
MQNTPSDHNKLEESQLKIKPALKMNLSESLNRKYPYFTAFIGCLVAYILSMIATWIVFVFILNVNQYGAAYVLTELIVRHILAFYGFKYVINENLLPYVNK